MNFKMKFLQYIFLSGVFVLNTANTLFAQRNSLSEQIQEIAGKYMADTGNVGLAIGIIDGEDVYKYNFGVKAKGSSDSVTSATLFEIGSVTKTFTGLLYTIYVNKGLLSPNDYIDKFLPFSAQLLPESRNKIMLWHLVTHTSGFPKLPGDFFEKTDLSRGNPYVNYDTTDLYKYLSKYTARSLGKKVAYSNVGAGLLGLIIERVSGSTLQNLFDKEVCVPLNMSHTVIGLRNAADSMNMAKGYNNGKQVLNWDFDVFAGAGALKSNLDDLLLYLKENIAPAGSDSLVGAIKKSQEKLFKFDRKNDIAAFWLIRKYKKRKEVFWHDGGTGGFRSFVAYAPVSKIGVVVLSNSTNSVTDMGFRILKKMMQ